MIRLVATSLALLTLAAPAPAGLKQLLADCQRSNSQRLIIQQAGKTVVDKSWSGDPDALVPLMFTTTAISALAVGCLVADGKLRSLDEKALPYIPQWKGTPFAQARIRDLVEGGRVSFYDPAPIGSLFSRPDPVGYLSKLGSTPTMSRPSYNLDAAVFLAPVITGLAGERADQYVIRRLFKPLGITKGRWRRDKAGQPDTATGLWLRPADLMKIGGLLLNDGRWNGRQVLPPGWIRLATTPEAERNRELPPGAPDGEVGHYLKMQVQAMITPRDLEAVRRRQPALGTALKPMVGRGFADSRDLIWEVLRLAPDREAYQRFVDGPRGYTVTFPPDEGYETVDFVGQTLYVHPRKKLVAVRTVPWDGRPVMKNPIQFEFDDLTDRIAALF